MSPEQVMDTLKAYRFEFGRCKYLRTRIDLLEKEIERAQTDMVNDLVGPGAQVITDMPRGTTMGNPTEKYGMLLADGWMSDDLREMLSTLDTLKSEHETRSRTVSFVESWLSGLPERERWMIEKQVIDGVFWREILADYQRDFGEYRSKDTLKRLRNRALNMIYDMAE